MCVFSKLAIKLFLIYQAKIPSNYIKWGNYDFGLPTYFILVHWIASWPVLAEIKFTLHVACCSSQVDHHPSLLIDLKSKGHLHLYKLHQIF